jgi:sigma-E factor negative regulatory protein RseA
MSGTEMTDSVKEQLSACLDGELPEGELDLLLKRLARDPQLRQAMGSYALVGEVLRAERPVTASAGFAARISAALAAEPQTATPVATPIDRDRSTPRFSPAVMQWLKPAAGLAIAAGVAAIAVFSVQPDAPQPEQVAANPSSVVTSSGLTTQADQSSYTVPTNTTSTAFIPATRLTNYVVAHSEYSSPLGLRAVVSGVLSDDEEQASVETEQPAAESLAPRP